jgi:zinc protease
MQRPILGTTVALLTLLTAPLAMAAPTAKPAAPPAKAATQPAKPAAATPLDRNKVPAPAAVRPFQFPNWQEHRLSNGLPVVIVERHANPVVSFRYLLKGGANTDPAGKAGRASLATDLWTKGTAGKTSTEIDETVEFYGAALQAGADRQYAELALNTASEHFNTLLPLVAEVALHPALPESEFVQARARAVTDLQQAADKVGDLADRALSAQMFANHPYGSMVQGSVATVGKLTSDDLAAFFKENLQPANAMIVVSGDVQPQALLGRLETLFGKTPAGKANPAKVPATKPTATLSITVIDKPGAVQSALRVAAPGLTPKDKDADAWEVANAILGGLFTSRLNANLREAKGYTYGAGSRYTSWEQPGYVAARTNVETKHTVPAVGEILKEFTRMRQEPVSKEELAKAKAYLIGTFPARFETAADIGEAVSSLKLMGLPVDQVRKYRERVNAVTVADVQRVSQRFLAPNRLTLIVAGDAKVTEGLKAFGPVVTIKVSAQIAKP